MRAVKLFLFGLALGIAPASASAQTIDFFVNGGWVVNTSSSVGPVSATTLYNPPPPCNANDAIFAQVEYDIRLVPGSGVINYATVYGKYSGSNHAGCDLVPVSASAGESGYASFIHSPGTGSFSFELESNSTASAFTPHADGELSVDLTLTLVGGLVQPPGIYPLYSLQRSTSASISGLSAPVETEFALVTDTVSNKNRFSISAVINGDSSLELPNALVSAFSTVSAKPNSNSFISLY